MPARIWEAFDSRDADLAKSGTDHRARFFIDGTDDDGEAKGLALFNVPGYWANPQGGDPLTRQSIRVRQVGQELFEVEADYGPADDEDSQEEPETGGSEESFDTSGGTQHITTAIARKFGKGKGPGGPIADAPDNGKAINVRRSGTEVRVDGVDIVVPTLKLVRTHYLPASIVTSDYIKTLARLTGKTNKDPWKGFAAGELLFLGAQGQRRGRGDWAVTFTHDASENITGMSVGEGTYEISGIDKRGWEYFWVEWQTTAGSTSLVPQPRYAYVDQVYREGDYALLGIGS
jgi:hypothetical protein